ncbi:hypothetical protein HDA32_006028 [Spinactinospora alkalitolerans]|uniref:Uncharacterized protein n=1 Tax=Spinactinospora alkalitolerans TaxID=687207 RepID=A0A852U3W3_9ACTN|nr:hypothetical protein [Spinactinospora alkalitolerans]NYE50908.1 hypothetical protein [Spinactinospora alkalitolerans]
MATSAAMLPVYGLDLVRRYWAPLLCVYTAGQLLHSLMLRGMVQIAGVNGVAALAGLSVSILVTLATTIVMFHLLRPGMPALEAELFGGRADVGQGGSTFADRERRIVDAVAMAILPFLIFYSAWGLFVEEYREYAVSSLNEHGLAGITTTLEYNELGLPLVIALIAWSGRTLCEKFYTRNQNKWLGVLTALFEANWMFFAVFSVTQVVVNAKGWVAGRVVVAEAQEALLGLTHWLGDLTSLPVTAGYLAAIALVAELWTHLKDGLIEPLLWLTIVAVVFGAEVDKAEALFRKGGKGGRIQKVATRVPNVVRGLGQFAGRDLREKYTPFLNAFRFILRVSPAFYLSFCLYYVLLELGFGWLERGVYRLVGPHEFLAWWWQWLTPIEFGVGALHELLRVCLLAATFEMTLRRMGSRSVGRRARRRADLPG